MDVYASFFQDHFQILRDFFIQVSQQLRQSFQDGDFAAQR